MLNYHKNHIFKFMPFGVNALKTLIKNELWFGSPQNLNDPFESHFEINFKGGELPSNDVLTKYYKEELQNKNAIIDKVLYCSLDTNYFLKDVKEAILKSLKDKTGICSFSKSYLNTKMWSHYADSHKGICLIFDRKLLEENFKTANLKIIETEIEYCDSLHSIEVSFNNNKILINNLDRHKIITTKLNDWVEESEIRFSIDFFNSNHYRNIPFDKKALKGIIFGENTEIDTKNTLGHLFRERKGFIWAEAYKNYIIGKMDVKYIHPNSNKYSNNIFNY